jgi:hypothetical protein
MCSTTDTRSYTVESRDTMSSRAGTPLGMMACTLDVGSGDENTVSPASPPASELLAVVLVPDDGDGSGGTIRDRRNGDMSRPSRGNVTVVDTLEPHMWL